MTFPRACRPRGLAALLFTLLVSGVFTLLTVAASHAQEAPPPPPREPELGEKQEKKKRKKEKKEQVQLDEARKQRKDMPGDVASLFARAQELVAKKKWIEAREILLVLEDNTDAQSIQPEVKLALADTYFGEGDILNLVEALTRYRNFLTYFPHHEQAATAQFQIANCYWEQKAKPDRDQSQIRNALYEYQKLLELYPGSAHADASQARILECRDRLARHELGIADYYYSMEAWNAVIGRLQRLVIDYPEFGGRDQAYFMLAQSFYAIGSKAEGDIFRRQYEEAGGKPRGFNVPKEGKKPTAGEGSEDKKARKQREKELQQMLEEEKKAEKERKKAAGKEPKKESVTEQQKAAEKEQKKAEKEQQKAEKEQQKAEKEQQKAEKEQQKAAEEEQKKAEKERKKAAEEEQKAVEKEKKKKSAGKEPQPETQGQ